jgi:hypothetical protein
MQSDAQIDRVAERMAEAQLWSGVWEKMSEPERAHYRLMAPAAMAETRRIDAEAARALARGSCNDDDYLRMRDIADWLLTRAEVQHDAG